MLTRGPRLSAHMGQNRTELARKAIRSQPFGGAA